MSGSPALRPGGVKEGERPGHRCRHWPVEGKDSFCVEGNIVVCIGAHCTVVWPWGAKKLLLSSNVLSEAFTLPLRIRGALLQAGGSIFGPW